MHLTLNKLSFYDEAYKLKVKMQDEQMYIAGCYTFKALTTALHNFSLGFDTKHNHKPLEYLDKPFLSQTIKKNLDEMSEEELNKEIEKAIMAEEMWIKAEKAKGLPSAKFSGR